MKSEILFISIIALPESREYYLVFWTARISRVNRREYYVLLRTAKKCLNCLRWNGTNENEFCRIRIEVSEIDYAVITLLQMLWKMCLHIYVEQIEELRLLQSKLKQIALKQLLTMDT